VFYFLEKYSKKTAHRGFEPMPRTVFYFLEKYSKKIAALGVRTQAFLLTRMCPNQLDCNEKYSIKNAALGVQTQAFLLTRTRPNQLDCNEVTSLSVPTVWGTHIHR
jgi:hypothetical protein